MTTAEQWIDRQTRRLRFGEFLERAAEWLAGFLFVFGTAVLIAKLAAPALWPHVLWAGLLAIPVLIGAWMHSGHGGWTRAEAVALLDRRLDQGGLLMTLVETPDAEWARKLPVGTEAWHAALPRVRPVRFLRWIALPLVFAVATGFVPARSIEIPKVVVNETGKRATKRLELMLESLEEVAAIEKKDEQELRDEIAKLEEETKRGPLTHERWETIDALEKRMRIRLETAGLHASQAGQTAATLAAASRSEEKLLSPERAERLEKALVETLRKMAKNGAFEGASPELKEQLQRLAKNRNYKLPQDPATRRRMLDELREHLDQESRRLAEARKKLNCEGECSACGGRHGEGECPLGEGSLAEREGEGNRPGRGGVSRGPGSAGLTYGDESDAHGTKFQETILPPGFLDQPKEELFGVVPTAPEVDPADSAPRGAARKIGATSGSETSAADLRPRHRDAVKRYFGSQK